MSSTLSAAGKRAARAAGQPGPVYDNACKLLAGRDLPAVCGCLGVQSLGEPVRLSEALPGAARTADLIAETGPNRLVHVEFVRRPRAELAVRMLEYRARILKLHPDHAITQHVVVLAGGRFTCAVSDEQLTLRLDVTYLRDQNPDDLLANPSLAPLAVLGRARGPAARAEILRKALAVVATVGDPQHRLDLLSVTATLAGIHLDADTVKQLTKEADMPFTLDENTVAGRSIARKHYRRGRSEGRTEGRAEGRAEGAARERAEALALLLRVRFGDDPRVDDLARRLATLPRDQAFRCAAAPGATLDTLDGALPPA